MSQRRSLTAASSAFLASSVAPLQARVAQTVLQQRKLAAHVAQLVGVGDPARLDLEDGDLVDEFADRRREWRSAAPPGGRASPRRALRPLRRTRRSIRRCGRLPEQAHRVGYHGESSRSRSQRHSASFFSATHTGRAERAGEMGDRRVAGDDEIEHALIAAAVSMKASGPASKSSPSVSTRMPGGKASSCSTPKPFCSEIRRTPGVAASGAKAAKRDGARHVRLGIGVALPDDADLEARIADARRPFRAPAPARRPDREPAPARCRAGSRRRAADC